MSKYYYVLITPARNEEAYIERTIKSVLSQTVLPQKWVIVSDGSVDHTDEIISSYEAKYDFIRLIRRDPDCKRNFGSEIKAFYAGYYQLENVQYDYIGKLDADLSFESDYFECILNKLSNNMKLGIAGGTIYELQKNGEFRARSGNRKRSVPGAIQLFRRECFDEIGGFLSDLKHGGADTIAEVMARMKGWSIQSFQDTIVLHYRQSGTANKGILFSSYYGGIQDYSIAYHPIYEIAKSILRIREKPYVLSSLLRIIGYFSSYLRKEQLFIPRDVIEYFRQEQISRLKLKYFKF